jgi:hypothetical protein
MMMGAESEITACKAAACADSGGIWTGSTCKYIKCFGKTCQ